MNSEWCLRTYAYLLSGTRSCAHNVIVKVAVAGERASSGIGEGADFAIVRRAHSLSPGTAGSLVANQSLDGTLEISLREAECITS